MTNKINNNLKKINVSNNNNNNNNLFEFTYLLETLMLIKVINKLLRFVDIDECSTRDSLPCDANADCINTFGSYNCTCRIGYSGNGTTCTGQYTAFTRLNAAQKIRLLSNSRTLSLVASVAGARKQWVKERTGARRGTREGSPFRAPVFSCAHYFQAPATQAISLEKNAAFIRGL